ncbi:hypothetical protein J32TS6_39810 [Virgibacillus pantothenticus]|uniref:Uncharacterized protein n=1 Tax=Virgibacillus pantothenticus TaxID=1473 RepID=A0A0L0QRB5_VIRPA|nr:hypothetical protein BKP57_02420 [Virgibacillus sp. 6R]KNE20753.1 hypothetical protein AFK71_20745 [Virgibacillus pantothenticus]GIP65426.1 hypothetical protein J32TS6_39810 [Virgibacillus pantothenticus]SIT03737.1 hypothetical protein SAMN05421787_11161 [Virgibacillus pantothenticus]
MEKPRQRMGSYPWERSFLARVLCKILVEFLVVLKSPTSNGYNTKSPGATGHMYIMGGIPAKKDLLIHD